MEVGELEDRWRHVDGACADDEDGDVGLHFGIVVEGAVFTQGETEGEDEGSDDVHARDLPCLEVPVKQALSA